MSGEGGRNVVKNYSLSRPQRASIGIKDDDLDLESP